MSEPTTTTTGVSDAAVGPGDAPREMTARARRAGWRQPQVRFWGVVTGVLVLTAVYLLVAQWVEWSGETRLVRDGAVVQATVWDTVGKVKGRPVAEGAGIELSYEYGGQAYKIADQMEEHKGVIASGQVMPIRVDPANPKRWTSRTEAPALIGKMMPPLLLLPPLLIAAIATVLARRRVMGVWRDGVARRAVVVGVGQTPMAPLSQAVRCALPDARDKRLMTVYVPQRFGRLAKGDSVWVVAHPTKPQRAVAAAVFQ